MSPLDDELRSLLHARADVLAPAADPLGGVERRARRMRRTRVAASVAGAALAVSAVAIAVPALRPGDDGGATQFAKSPVASPSATAPSAAALDPQHPWAYRGDPAVVAGGELVTLRAEWATKHPGAVATPLFGQVYEPSGRPEVVFVSTAPDGDRWGVATSSEAGWEFVHDVALTSGTTVLMAALTGDEVPRLLVVAAPSSGAVQYAPDGRSYHDIQATGSAALYGSPGRHVETSQPGIGITPLEGDTSHDTVRVLDGDGDLDHPVFEGPAPDYAGSTEPSPAPAETTPPAEVTSAPALAAQYAFDPAHPWAYRGAAQDGTGDIVSTDRKQFMTTHPESAGEQDTTLYAVHLSATTDVAVALHTRTDRDYVSFTAHDGSGTHQVVYEPTPGEDILSAYVPLDDRHGLLIAVVSDQAGSVVLQTGSRAEIGGSRTAGIWDWAPGADSLARLAAFAKGDIEPYASQPAT